MARLIDANKLENDLTNDICGIPLHGNCKTNYANIRATIRAKPAIDAVPVVYCHKCKMFGHIAGKSGHCYQWHSVTLCNDFCSYGERRED